MNRAVLFAIVVVSLSSRAFGGIANGSFETGDFTGWTTITTGSPFAPWSVGGAGDSGYFSPLSPQDGSRVAWNGFDGDGPMQFALYQDVAIPMGVSTISWQDRVQWELTSLPTLSRTYAVLLLDPSTDGLLEILHLLDTGVDSSFADTGWQTHSADVSYFAGSSVRLVFFEDIPESFTGPGQLEIDNVVLTTTPVEVVPEFSSLAIWSTLGLSFCCIARMSRRHCTAG
jgi:hypothetical protein